MRRKADSGGRRAALPALALYFIHMFLTGEQQMEIAGWAVLATHLNGAVDSGKYDHIDTTVVLKHVKDGDVFEFLGTELGKDVEYAPGETHRCPSAQAFAPLAYPGGGV